MGITHQEIPIQQLIDDSVDNWKRQRRQVKNTRTNVIGKRRGIEQTRNLKKDTVAHAYTQRKDNFESRKPI